MTLGQLAAAAAVRRRFNSEALIPNGISWSRMLRPTDGWISVTLLALNLIVVVWSVDHANWVATPNLAFVVLLAMVTGLVLARLPFWGALVFPVGLGLGLLVVVWRITSSQGGDAAVADAGQLWDRLDLWFTAVKSGNINIDQVPFAFGVLVVTWLLGYVGVWVFARYRNFWGVFVLGGIGLLSNLTYLPPSASLFLGIYLFSALLLVARVQSVRRRHDWRRRNFKFDENLGVLSLTDSVFLAALVLLAAFLIPPTQKFGPTHSAYEFMRSPMGGWEGDFNRLFAGIPARRPLGYRIWGDVMAFQGSISPTTTEVLRVESPVAMYLKARTYGTYTSKGWVSEGTSLEAMDWVPSFAVPQARLDRIEVNYSVTPKYASRSLFGGAQVLSTNRSVQVETYDSPVYTLDLSRPQAADSLPPRLAEAAENLNRAVLQRGALVDDATLANSLPQDLRLLEVFRAEGEVQQATVVEVLPALPDVLSVRSSDGKVKAGDTYQITSSVSVAKSKDLRSAGRDYPTWALMKYTQLPEDIPQRVRDLGAQLTSEAETPYDKAKAIEDYLASFTYNLKIEPPPFNADGVDHFLFTLQEGYSEYFASAMTVLLRTVGVPARLATGYTAGDKVPDQNLYRVTDSHSHAWVEVFFPAYGWISFEPTPGKFLPEGLPLESQETSGGDTESEYRDPIEYLCIEVQASCFEDTEAAQADDASASRDTWPGKFMAILPWLLSGLGIVALLAATASFLWRRYMFPSGDPRAIYRRLAFLGGLGSVGPLEHQTPFQYRERLRTVLPNYREDVSVLVEAYVRSRYGAKELSFADRHRLADAWLRIRLPLLLRFFRRRTV